MDEKKHKKALIRGYLDLVLSSISIMAVIISLIALSFLRWDLIAALPQQFKKIIPPMYQRES